MFLKYRCTPMAERTRVLFSTSNSGKTDFEHKARIDMGYPRLLYVTDTDRAKASETHRIVFKSFQ